MEKEFHFFYEDQNDESLLNASNPSYFTPKVGSKKLKKANVFYKKDDLYDQNKETNCSEKNLINDEINNKGDSYKKEFCLCLQLKGKKGDEEPEKNEEISNDDKNVHVQKEINIFKL